MTINFTQPNVIKLMGVHNPLGAMLAQKAGFDALWLSGLELSTSLGLPDLGVITMTECVERAGAIVDSINIPLVVDCDSGFGSAKNLYRVVRLFEKAGCAAICVEDKVQNKNNSLLKSAVQKQIPVEEFAHKIEIAKSAQVTEDFKIIARIESFIAGAGLDDAIVRAERYAQAGADALLIHSKKPDPSEIKSFVNAYEGKVPIVVVPTMYPNITVDELEALGIKAVIYANHGIRACISAYEHIFKSILRNGSLAGIDEQICTLEDLFTLTKTQDYLALELNDAS